MPPFKNVLLIVDENQLYYEMPFDVWLKENPKLVQEDWQISKGKDRELIGLECQTFHCKRLKGPGTAYFAACKSLPISAQVAQVCCRFCGAPIGFGLPIIFLPKDDHNSVYLSAKSLTPQEVPSGTFVLPTDYKKARDETDLYLSGREDYLFQTKMPGDKL